MAPVTTASKQNDAFSYPNKSTSFILLPLFHAVPCCSTMFHHVPLNHLLLLLLFSNLFLRWLVA